LPGGGMLVPLACDRPSYLLLLDAAFVSDSEEPQIAALADQALMKNPQYRYARELGQLPVLAASRIENPVGNYNRICLAAGRRLGDIKPTALASSWWAEAFLKVADN
jgi:hypothetical protein